MAHSDRYRAATERRLLGEERKWLGLLETARLNSRSYFFPQIKPRLERHGEDSDQAQRFDTLVLSNPCSFEQRRRPETLCTAMATAFFWPTRTTSRLPRVMPM